MCGTFSRSGRVSTAPAAPVSARQASSSAAIRSAKRGPEKRRTTPGNRPRQDVPPSSEESNSICSPTQTPSRGLLRAARTTASRRPDSFRVRMQSAMAPWPGNTTRSAASMSWGWLQMRMSASGAANFRARATEWKLPIP
ncbi:hypothetical protein G6F65_016985 [Rhizopus arrhizus]|nr:hypothetical protein G6F65_016985 [Rhizopus arrhizus]